MSDTDFASLIEDVARHFWGDHNPKLSSKTELRWGGQGSRAVFLDGPGNWKDFEADIGGGVIDLVKAERKCSKAEAIEWLEGENYIAKRDSERRDGPQRQERPRASNEPADQESPPADAPQAQMKAVKGYRYTDADGNPLYEVIRYQFMLPDGSFERGKDGNLKKTFRQRRPDGRGGYIWNLEGIGHTIYRRPEVEMAIEAGWPIVLCEGEKDVETIEGFGQGVVATTNSGGAKHWTDEMAALLRDADVIILPDNDDAGRDGAEIKAKSLKGIARSIKVLDLAALVPDFPPKGDVTDWVQRMGGTFDQFLAWVRELQPWRPRRPQSRFGALSVKDAIKYAANHDWLVDDLIEAKGTFAFAGNSQSGKTFQVIELAFCVATGRKYWGRDVKQGLVVYQVGEGEDGFMKRLAGHMQDRGIEAEGLPLEVLPRKINLFSGEDDTNDLIKAAKDLEAYYGIPLRMIVIDTYNKATRGANEISGQDVGKINERLERIMTECNCAVGVVDHLSAGGRVRGHGSKTGDITNMIIVEKDEKKVDRNGRPIRRMRLDKNKDGENGGTIPFVLRQVVVGFREDGKAITTCVVEAPDGNDEELEKSGRLPLNQSIILQTIRDVIAREGYPAPPDMPEEVRRPVVAWKTVMAELRRKWLYKAPENEPEAREHELHRIVTDAGRKLQNNGYIDRDNTKGIVWWTGKTDRPLFKPKAVEPEPAGTGVAPAAREEIKQMAMDEVPF